MASFVSNRLLSCLSQQALDQVMASSSHLALPLKMQLYAPNECPSFAFFITSGLASVVTTTQDGDTAEVGIIGNDGLVGGMHLLGPAPVSTSAFMQIEGAGIRVPYAHLQSIYRSSDEVRDRLLEFAQEQALTVSHIAACNRLHDVEERLARWLLMAQDRTQSDILKLTQEFLGMMLGSRRTTVTLIAGTFQRIGLIEYSRGKVKIVNRVGLEEVACDCYQISKSLQAGLYSRGLEQYGAASTANHHKDGYPATLVR